MSNYFVERNLKNLETIERLLNELPSFCFDYFISIESQTSTLTRLNYAHDLKIFFYYLQEKKFRKNHKNSHISGTVLHKYKFGGILRAMDEVLQPAGAPAVLHCRSPPVFPADSPVPWLREDTAQITLPVMGHSHDHCLCAGLPDAA